MKIDSISSFPSIAFLSKNTKFKNYLPIYHTNSEKPSFLQRGLEGIEAEDSLSYRKTIEIFNKTQLL